MAQINEEPALHYPGCVRRREKGKVEAFCGRARSLLEILAWLVSKEALQIALFLTETQCNFQGEGKERRGKRKTASEDNLRGRGQRGLLNIDIVYRR